jgi:two-component system nitrogen regulation sensor histidine kinase NtrY
MAAASASKLNGIAGRWREFRRRLQPRAFLVVGYILAVLVTVAAVYFSTRAPGAGHAGPASRIVLDIVLANLVLILALAAAVGWRILKVLRERGRDAGARLHTRFVTMFALAAVVPAILMALFFGPLVTRGVENWFSKRVRTVVETSASVAKSYVSQQVNTMANDLIAMAADLQPAEAVLRSNPATFQQMVRGQADIRGFPAAYVIDRQGNVLARFEDPKAPPFVPPTEQSLEAADGGDVAAKTYEAQGLLREAVRLRGYDGAYLYAVRRVDVAIFHNLTAASGALEDYREAEANRHQIQAAFLLTYLETVLLVTVGAVWLGMSAANAISAPVAQLVAAAHRVSDGDLDARVAAPKAPEEMAMLSHAFNRMTHDLQAQQKALKAASEEAESRRAFIETVLAGVSAGVLGLDADGAISAANQPAHKLLDLGADAIGRPLRLAAPELGPIAAAAARTGGEAEEELDVVRGGETRRLRVRASAAAEGGLVLTFDDITRLVTAQRSAAWRDVARRIAHEIKNPLTPIQLSAERIRRKYRKEISGDLETFDRCTDTIIRQVGDIGRMVDEFSAFARMPAPRFEPQSANELIRQAVFAERVRDPETVIDLQEPAEEVVIQCDSRMIAQALANLLKNAGEAIQARRQAFPAVKGHIQARLVLDARGLAFEVEDNGVGLPSADRARLTEPYVTTREKGTGLGLAIVKRIQEEHGGELILSDASESPGAKATLRFPPTAIIEKTAPQGVSVV